MDINQKLIYFDKTNKECKIINDNCKFKSKIWWNCNYYWSQLHSPSNMLVSVNGFIPNNYRINNIFGNASEILQKEKILKGGNWESAGYSINPYIHELYTGSSPNIGFRCFMEVIEN